MTADLSEPLAGSVVAPPAGLRGLVLDVDDTLLNTRAAMRAAGAAAAARLWPHLDQPQVEAAGHRYHADPRGHFRAFTRGEHDLETMRHLRVREVAEWLGLPWAAADTGRWRNVFDEVFIQELVVFADVLPALDLCHELGLRVALLTNADGDYTWTKLQRCGLAAPLQDRDISVVTKDTLGFGKPAPEVFRHAAGLLGLSPGEVAHVGDELDVDPVAALAAGMGAGWLRRAGYEVSEAELREAQEHGLAPLSRLDETIAELVARSSTGFGSTASAR